MLGFTVWSGHWIGKTGHDKKLFGVFSCFCCRLFDRKIACDSVSFSVKSVWEISEQCLYNDSSMIDIPANRTPIANLRRVTGTCLTLYLSLFLQRTHRQTTVTTCENNSNKRNTATWKFRHEIQIVVLHFTINSNKVEMVHRVGGFVKLSGS